MLVVEVRGSAGELKSPVAISWREVRAGPARNSAAWASWTAANSPTSRWVLTKRNLDPRRVAST